MASVNVNEILRRVYGFRGLPFPGKPNAEPSGYVAPEFSAPAQTAPRRSRLGAPLWGTNALGRPVFMPAKLGGKELHNPLITITGEKAIVSTDVVDVGTVYEKVFTRPYDITIICTLIWNPYQDGGDYAYGGYPEAEMSEIEALYVQDAVLTLECALTDIFLEPKDNFLVRRLAVLDMQGIENAQVVQIDGSSNIDFELEYR